LPGFSISLVDLGKFGDVYTSITIGTDGLPIISYHDLTEHYLKVAHCEDAQCASATVTTLDSTVSTGHFTSIAIGSDGLPVIAYSKGALLGTLIVAHCQNVQCTSAVSRNIAFLSESPAITIGADGFPLISYHDDDGKGLKVAHCQDVYCSSVTLTVVDDGLHADVGWFSSITIGSDGLPVISYFDQTNGWLKVAHCNDATCGSASLTLADPVINISGDFSGTAGVGQYTSITIGADGFPIISYYDMVNSSLKLTRCLNVQCTQGSNTTVDSAGSVGQYTSIALGADGAPVISYWDQANEDLKVARCSGANCSIIAVDSIGPVGKFSSITIGVDGFPIISYWDRGNGTLKVVHCSNKQCVPNHRRR
jgi:predicted regulator of Ras-like GTPase activity (Roadblock/LC7/MglB family)